MKHLTAKDVLRQLASIPLGDRANVHVIRLDIEGNLFCTCGNTSHLDGFSACDESGNECAPVDRWQGHYVCMACAAIWKDEDKDAYRS